MSDQIQTGRTIPVAIEDEVKESYLNYAMSVIVSRALPDVRDGLKPVHRRILYAMNEMGLRHERPYKKCARIVGDVLGKYHPHGDQSVYDALARMAQSFSMRYQAVDGQGNFGSVDGDPPAAMRYTEARMGRIAEEMLRDINKDTVDFGPNYDDSDEEPLVLPAAFPYLLANGASGIAVGMATNIPPHNLNEIANAVAAYIDNHDISVDGLIEHIKGPDFPTGGTIYGTRGIKSAYRTGRGRITVRARFSLEENKKGRDVILVTELPYMVNKAILIQRIADLVHGRKIDGIADLRDESDRRGMRIVIELKRGYSPKVIINQLFMHTQMQVNFNVNALALVDGRPKLLNLKDMISAFVNHRKDVVIRRTKFDLKKAEDREHILEGLKIALDNIDEVIKTIRESETVDIARTALMTKFELSERQAQAILDMRLQKLTSLETQKIIEELEQVRALIRELRELLGSEAKLLALIKTETQELAEKYGDERGTEIDLHEVEAIDIEDLIQKEDMVVVISHRGFIKRVRYSSYRVQGRGGRGSNSSGNLREDDFIEHLFIGSTHDHILFFTSLGQAYYLKIHEIPEGSKQAKGVHVKTLLTIAPDEDVASVLTLKEFDPNIHLLFATARGQLIRVRSSDFVNAKKRGIRAVKMAEGDTLKSVFSITDADQIFLASRNGQGLRIQGSDVRLTGRGSKGVRGLVLKSNDELAGATPAPEDANVLLITERGFGKRVEYQDFRIHGRATQGMRAYTVTEDTGEVVSGVTVQETDEVMVITSQGLTIKLRAGDVSKFGRTARGVFVINIAPPDFVVGLARVQETEEEEAEAQPGTGEAPRTEAGAGTEAETEAEPDA